MLSTRLKEKKEKLEQLITNLVDESRTGKPIIVEGKKDFEALRALSVPGQIVTVKTGKSFLEVTEEIERLNVKEVILLLDFDRRGKEGMHRLQSNLEKSKIKTNTKFWLQLKGLLGKDIQCIESLTSYMKTLQEKPCKVKFAVETGIDK